MALPKFIAHVAARGDVTVGEQRSCCRCPPEVSMKSHGSLALALVLSVSASVLALGCGSDPAPAQNGAATCQIGQINCDGTCVLLASSPLHSFHGQE